MPDWITMKNDDPDHGTFTRWIDPFPDFGIAEEKPLKQFKEYPQTHPKKPANNVGHVRI